MILNSNDNVQADWNVSDANSDAYIKNKPAIGTYIAPSFTATSIPNSTETTVAQMTVPAGTWVITASLQWVNSFTQMYLAQLIGASPEVIVRNNGTNGGGTSIATIEQITSSKTIKLNIWQGSGSTQSINRYSLRAVRIA